MTQDSPMIEFFRGVPDARMPVRADKSALGSIPVAAYKYCQPLTTATGYGWYVYVPLNFALLWDGADTRWSYEGADAWYPLEAAQFPNFACTFDASAPQCARGFAPLFLADSPRRGIVQVWSGLFARSAPGWSLKIRPLVNYPVSKSFEPFEAIVETDVWFGPLFINIRLIRRNVPITFSVDRPLFQVQPVAQRCYAPSVYDECVMHEAPLDFGAREWRAFEETIVAPNSISQKQRGEYARRSRKREKSGVT